MKVMKGKMRQVIALLLIVAMVVTSMQISPVQAQAATKANLVTTYDGEGYTVTFKVTSQWSGAFNADVTIKNTSDKVIDNWAIGFAMPYEITKIWNGVVKTSENGMYEIKNAGSNQDIAVGKSVSFGFSAKADGVLVLPSAYDLLCFEEIVANDSYEISFKVTSDWKSAFNGEIRIKNVSEVTIEDWKLEFDFDHKIDRFWTAEIIKKEGNHYYIKNAGYNANIKPGETVVLGFAGNPGNVKTAPLNFGLSQIVSKIDETKDSDGDKLPDYYELIIGTNPRLKDTDQDGLEDGFEVAYGLNPIKPDSNDNGIPDGLEDFDDDGLTCIEEVQIGTLIYEADTDFDHLNDGDEVKKYFTNPLIPDTDADGLDDGAEIKFGMDPHKKDSNGDGILDGDEKIDQTLVQAIASEEREQVTQVSVSMKATGDIQYSTKIQNTYGKDVLSSGVVGLIGVPVNIESTSAFDEATITFTYDDTLLGETKEEDLRVMWYDEENNQYVIMDEETVLNTEQNTVSYTTTHFSTYLVVDRKAWYHVWSNALSYRRQPSNSSIPTEYFDICYVIDRSGSMSGTRIANAKMAIEGFVDAMYSNDRGAIVGFESYASVYSQFTSDKTILKNSLNSVYASGGTSVEAGLKAALDLFDATPNKVVNNCVNSKMILLLCDGDVTYTEVTLQRAVAKGIKIYPVLIGSTGGQASLQRFADLTGGKFYYAATAEEIRKSIFGIQEETIGDIDTTDTDGDGLYDVYEIAGMIIPNGQYIYSDPQKRDTDNDGLTDAKEMGVLENYDDQDIFKKMAFKLLGFDNEVYAEYFDYTSNPNEKDSDNDTYNDDVDAYPLEHIDQMEKVNYIFYSAGEKEEKYFYDEAMKKDKELRKAGKLVETIPIESDKIFINEWDSMGIDSENKVKYDMDKVYLYFHGDPDIIKTGKSGKFGMESTISMDNPYDGTKGDIYQLDDKKINKLIFRSCNTGNLDWINAANKVIYTQNIAICFMKQCPSIIKVEAIDGFLSQWHPYGADIIGGFSDINFQSWTKAKYGHLRCPEGEVIYTRKDNQIVCDVSGFALNNGTYMLLEKIK